MRNEWAATWMVQWLFFSLRVLFPWKWSLCRSPLSAGRMSSARGLKSTKDLGCVPGWIPPPPTLLSSSWTSPSSPGRPTKHISCILDKFFFLCPTFCETATNTGGSKLIHINVSTSPWKVNVCTMFLESQAAEIGHGYCAKIQNVGKEEYWHLDL